MRRLSLALGLLAACAATGASAETVNLTGTYRCIQMCRNGMLGAPTFVTQNGDAVNLTTETGSPTGPGPTGARPSAESGSMRATRALSIRPMACAFSSMMAASGSVTSARRRAWRSAARPWSTAGSFKRGHGTSRRAHLSGHFGESSSTGSYRNQKDGAGRMLRRCSDASAPPQFFRTIRPTTLPARNSSIHFWTSAIGSSFIGVGLILPARASAINSLPSARVPTIKPSMVMRL